MLICFVSVLSQGLNPFLLLEGETYFFQEEIPLSYFGHVTQVSLSLSLPTPTPLSLYIYIYLFI